MDLGHTEKDPLPSIRIKCTSTGDFTGTGYSKVTKRSVYIVSLVSSTKKVVPGHLRHHTGYAIETNTYFTALQGFTIESSWELMSLEEYCSALRKLKNKQRQVVMFLLLLFKLSSQLPFYLFFSHTCSLYALFSPFPFFPFLSTIPSFSSDQFAVLLR